MPQFYYIIRLQTTYLQLATLSHNAQCATLQHTIFCYIKDEWDINNSLQNIRTTAPQQHHRSNSSRLVTLSSSRVQTSSSLQQHSAGAKLSEHTKQTRERVSHCANSCAESMPIQHPGFKYQCVDYILFVGSIRIRSEHSLAANSILILGKGCACAQASSKC